MALKVRYHDGRTQLIAVDSYGSQGDYWRFPRNGPEVALIVKKSVESITSEGVPDPEQDVPEVEVSELKHAPRIGVGWAARRVPRS